MTTARSCDSPQVVFLLPLEALSASSTLFLSFSALHHRRAKARAAMGH
ncbi:TPA: hypothetical protein G9B77_002777 [Salmonella enterica]|nr:hypothetical protein [Salmonella enterica]